jgi:hypothetical protein
MDVAHDAQIVLPVVEVAERRVEAQREVEGLRTDERPHVRQVEHGAAPDSAEAEHALDLVG